MEAYKSIRINRKLRLPEILILATFTLMYGALILALLEKIIKM